MVGGIRRRLDRNEEERSHISQEEGRKSPTAIYNPFFTGRPRTPVNAPRKDTMDRREIMRRIKEVELPRQNVSGIKTLTTEVKCPKVDPRSKDDIERQDFAFI